MTTTTASSSYSVDSSGWIEYIGRGPKEAVFAGFIENHEPLVLPTIVLYEVYKKLSAAGSKVEAERFVSHALRQHVVRLDEWLAFAAAELSLLHKLPMADAIIYATSRARGAELITMDAHFEGLAGVTVV